MVPGGPVGPPCSLLDLLGPFRPPTDGTQYVFLPLAFLRIKYRGTPGCCCCSSSSWRPPPPQPQLRYFPSMFDILPAYNILWNTRMPNFATRRPETVEKGISHCKLEREIFSRGAKSDARYFLAVPPGAERLPRGVLGGREPP